MTENMNFTPDPEAPGQQPYPETESGKQDDGQEITPDLDEPEEEFDDDPGDPDDAEDSRW